MKTTLQFSVLSLLACSIQAQTWQTVDTYLYLPGLSAANNGLTVAPSGAIFASGYGDDGTNGEHGLVVASADDGNTWSAPFDDFWIPNASVEDGGMAIDSAGKLYVSGFYYYDTGNFHQFVRRSTDGGATWATVDDQAQSPLAYAGSGNITADVAGNVFVSEYLFTSAWTWLVRKGTGGTNFATVDTYLPSGGSAQANAVYVHPMAGVFSVGYASFPVKFGTSQFWLVRRSLDGGITWSTVDTYQATSGYAAAAYAVGADASGNIYVAGSANVAVKRTVTAHWIVRKSSNGGATWSTVDDYVGGAAHALSADSNGNLFVAGTAGGNGWIVRERLAGSGTWQTVDNLSGGTAASIAADGLGHVFVGGSFGNYWVMRRN